MAMFWCSVNPRVLDEIYILISHYNLKITKKIRTPHDEFIKKNANLQIRKYGYSNVNPTILHIQQTYIYIYIYIYIYKGYGNAVNKIAIHICMYG
jgi:hypothetical protein